MFGSKQGKTERLDQIVKLLEQNPEGLSRSELARLLKAECSTVSRDLAALEQRGVLLAEDSRARVSLFARLFGRK